MVEDAPKLSPKSPKKWISNPPRIPETFKGGYVFITGANGFVGKVLLEKLLRTCTGIQKIIVLLNSQASSNDFKDKQIKLLENEAFDRIKNECPDNLNKIRFVAGDIRHTDLNLDEAEKEIIIRNVNVVFHCAASVRFDEPPRAMLKINFIGTDNILQLCERIHNLEAVVHVSTAYSFSNHLYISEKLYPEDCEPEMMLQLLKGRTNDEQLEVMCAAFRKIRPSNYQYSKAMGESLICSQYSKLPIIIVRPSIITGAAKEPFPGWIDNINGPSGFLALSCKGILKTLLVKKGVNADWVPVDVVANTLIVAAHFLCNKELFRKMPFAVSSTGVPIINCVCPDDNQITWNEIVDQCIPLLRRYPSKFVCTVPGGVVTSSPVLHALCKYLFHFFPASLMDIWNITIRSQLRAVRQYKRIHGVMNHLQLYTTHHFFFSTYNMRLMIGHMHREDEGTFFINQGALLWPVYLEDYVKGVRKFYLKESEDDLVVARKRLNRVTLLMFCLKMLPIGLGILHVSKCVFHGLQLIPNVHFRHLVPYIAFRKIGFKI